MATIDHVRNFCIIAHIDHGKSTLADRFLELTNTVPKREMREQVLDQMDIERERGITIKLQPVRMQYQGVEFNLIDTPGHVDFTYEVSRSLAAVEGAILLVDAAQGIQAQTISNLYLALEHNLTIIPVINKIDLPNADIAGVTHQIVNLIGCSPDEIVHVSAKTGEGVEKVLQRVIERIPGPSQPEHEELQALIFDSTFDTFRGVVAYCRVISGSLGRGDQVTFLGTQGTAEVLEAGHFSPKFVADAELNAGSIGYIVTNLKSVRDARVGDTIAHTQNAERIKPLPGYRQLQPMVFAGLFPRDGDRYTELREAFEKLHLSDSAFTFEPEHSPAMGLGFRCGFLGLLHVEIVQERIRREYGIDVVVTVPSVAYRVYLNDAGLAAHQRKDKRMGIGKEVIISSPLDLPEKAHIDHVEEPWVEARIVTPPPHVGGLMQFVQDTRGVYKNTEYLDEQRVVLTYDVPLASLLVDFYDTLKSVSSGYASLSYDLTGYRRCEVERLNILIADEPVDALSSIVYTDDAYRAARRIVDRLKDVIPRQLFEVKIQAAIGGRVVASAKISQMRKDVTAKLYGGDVTRKRKLLEKQKKGKKKMRQFGKVTLPQDAFLAVLKRNTTQ